MNFWDNKICKKLGRQKFLIFVLILFLLANICIVLYAAVLSVLSHFIDLSAFTANANNLDIKDEFDFVLRIISGCIFAPIIETLLCQNLLIYLLNKLSSNKTFQLLTASAIFGLLHYINASTFAVFNAFLMGLVFNFGFILYKENKSLKQATHAVITVHCLRNCMAFIHIISKL
jgi:hypothetical protein